MTLGRNLEAREVVHLPDDTPPILLVVIDTEEEFDWESDFDRHSTAVTAAEHIPRAQSVFEEFEIRPIYVVDFPIADNVSSAAIFSELKHSGTADVGIHLHPWVNPPHDEKVTRRHSYQGNLAAELELAKLSALRDRVVENLKVEPRIHKAGRYGFGAHTAEHLLQLGIEIDLSAAPGFDYSSDDGPDYSRIDANLYRFGPNKRLFGIPTTGGFMGPLHGLGYKVHSATALSSTAGRLAASTLSRTRLLERVMVSPEGHSLDKMVRMTRALTQRGIRVITLSFHSPTVKPGCTPYTQSSADVAQFLDKCRRYFDFFFQELKGITLTPYDIQARALASDNNAL